VWSAEERAEGLEYMHPKPSSHSGRIVGYPSLIALRQSCPSTGPDATLHERIFAQRVCTDIPRWLQSKILDHPDVTAACHTLDC
jgi:hypothetical protein